jgi:hypothetical protein
MPKLILTTFCAATLMALPTFSFAAEEGAAAGAATGAAAGAVVGGPVGAAVGAGVGGVTGGAATGPNRNGVVVEQRGTGCSTTTRQTTGVGGTTTQQRTDC